jgi:acyl-CoA thioesterase-1
VQRFNTASILAAAGLLAINLLGCKADPGKSAVSPVVSTSGAVVVEQPSGAAVEDARPVIACFGDSITAGLGVDPELNYPTDLQHELDARGFGYRVANFGVSGETTKDGLARVSQVLFRKPELVIVEFGGNDGLRGLPLAESQRSLLGIVTALQQGGAKVLVVEISLPAQYGQDYIGRFQAIYPAIARQAHVPLLTFAQLTKGLHFDPTNIQDDGIHPTAAGDAIIARNVADNIAPMLKR